MKNDSWFFPFSMPGDKFFDSNNDGKLSDFETICRDAQHMKMERKFNENKKSKYNTPILRGYKLIKKSIHVPLT